MITFLIVCMVCMPTLASAQTPDEVIEQVIRTLRASTPQLPVLVFPQSGTSSVSNIPTTGFVRINPLGASVQNQNTSTNDSALPPSTQTSESVALPVPQQNSPSRESESEIAQLKSLIAVLTAQVQGLLARARDLQARIPVAPQTASTTAATTTEPVALVEEEELDVRTFRFERDIALGARGDDVSVLQELLTAKNFFFGDITGYFGPLTRTALRAFQAEYGLPQLGSVGVKTRDVLNRIAREPNFGRVTETPEFFTSGSTSMPVNASTSIPFTASSTQPFGSNPTAVTGAATSGPVAVSLSLLPARAPIGGAVSLTWLTQNATSCEGSDGWSGPKPTLGAARVEPLSFSLTFVLTCTGPEGVASTSATVIVTEE
jgi:peptidoglycan hydrolase-like protein with peptidoglycan-binding domain